jgi:hypothetical protein
VLLISEYLRELSRLFKSLSLRARLLSGIVATGAAFWFARLLIWLISGSALYAVGGAVTYDGKPVASGTIVFDPTADGQRREALIKEGRYSLARESGLLRNAEYLVRVRAFRKTGKKYENADPTSSFDEYEQYLPEQYYSNPSIKVTATRRAFAKGFDLILVSDPRL